MSAKPNRLIGETSPYLRQHAYNPVDWYPWGEEALKRAKEEDRPILLSIGYSSCHWCHVMERESFEDPETAKLMNENFINIKVDREERPDLDAIYMDAVQVMAGRGGWPLTVFLTPDGKPFYGGTYFPLEPRHGMPSFRQVLFLIADSYKTSRGRIEVAGTELQKMLQGVAQAKTEGELEPAILDAAFISLSDDFDTLHGGFGRAPKFPQPLALEFLLRLYARGGETTALKMVETTLVSMARGGVYDHLGGGFHRYSVDAEWLVPHFEKMLYDNALLTRVYLHAYQITKNDHYKRVVEESLDYVAREMTHELGGFYSAQDADSEGEEGRLYLWSLDEIKSLLGGGDGEAFATCFGVTEEGNFEGKNSLNLTDIPDLDLGKIDLWRRRLFEHREKRVKPSTDDKVITAWNGLMMASFAEAGLVLNRPDYIAIAEKNAEFVLGRQFRKGRLLRIWREGEAKQEGYLEDYSFYADALLALYQGTFRPRWLTAAQDLADVIWEHFSDEEGNFYDTADYHEKLIVARPRGTSEGATPSGGSVAARVLLTLAAYTGEARQRGRAEKALKQIAGALERHPGSFANWLCALDFYLSPPKELAIIGDLPRDDTRALLSVALETYRPNMILAVAPEGEQVPPLLAGKSQIGGRATAYVCHNFSCENPTTDPEELSRILAGA